MSKKIKQLLVNFTVLLIALCFSVILAEILVRIFFSEVDASKWFGQNRNYYKYDEVLGWKIIPNLNKQRVTAGYPPVVYRTNSRSIRGGEYTYGKPDNESRILFLGDSFTEGYMVEFQEMFSEVMENKLNKIGNDKYFESINTGTIGWSTDQELLYFQREGKKYNPDRTILMFCENDIAYVNQRKDYSMNYKPMFKIKDGELVLTNVPVPKPDIFLIHEPLRSKKKSVIESLRSWFDSHSILYKLVKKRIKNTYTLREPAAKSNKTDNKLLLPLDFQVWEKKYNEDVHKSWKTVEALILKLQEETSSIGSKLVVFYIPSEASIYREEWRKLKRKYGFTDKDWTPDQAGIVLEKICKKNNIDFINPTEVFKAKADELEKDAKRLYNSVDHHWTVEGNELTGNILADFIASRYSK